MADHKLDYKSAALRLGISPGTTYNWERGTSRPSVPGVRRLAGPMGVVVGELLVKAGRIPQAIPAPSRLDMAGWLGVCPDRLEAFLAAESNRAWAS